VSRALALLAAEGLVVSRPGAGTFVAEPPIRRTRIDSSWQTVALSDRIVDTEGLGGLNDPPHDEQHLSLATGYLHSSLMPTRALSAALTRASRLPDAWERPPTSGIHGLRSWFATAVSSDIEPRDVIITTGGQSAISAIVRALIPAGGPLLIESPTYPGALAVARAARIRPIPVPTDEGGVIPELLADAFERTGAQAFYSQPTYQNPTGSVLARERRGDVLAAAAAAGAFVIEDDYARWLGHGSKAPPPLLADDREGRVVYLTSLTKVASPSLRIGAMISRGPVTQRLQSLRIVDDMFVPRPTQEAALDLVSRPVWERHLHDLSVALRSRSRALARAIDRHIPDAEYALPPGGMHLWTRLPDGIDDVKATLAARRAGVAVNAGRPFFPAEAAAPHVRITFSAVPSEADLETGVRRLARAIAGLERDSGD